MIAKTLTHGLIVVAALVATNSFAASHAAGEMKAADMMKMPADMMKMPMVDTNKDGMITKAEYVAAAGKMFDMKAKEMKAKDGMMNSAQYEQYLKDVASTR